MKAQTTVITILLILAGLALLFYVLGQGENQDNQEENEETAEGQTNESTDESIEEDADSDDELADTSPEDEDQTDGEGSEPVTVTFNGTSYDPSTFSVEQGTTVTWVNQSDRDMWPASNVHPTHEIYSEFDPQQPVLPGESWSFTFEDAGEWEFHDHLQPAITGTITVE